MDTITKAQRSKLMSRIRSKDTKPEMAVRSLVHRMGYRYRLHDKKLPGSPDLVFTSRAKVIFVHGCFWHMHRTCYHIPKVRRGFWKAKLENNAARDKRTRQKLNRMGWQSRVIWECQLRNTEKLKSKVRQFLG
jgi:DNA mismatch endonuclease (patch repair protein)